MQNEPPTAGRQNCSTVDFPIVIANYQNIINFLTQVIKVLHFSNFGCWDHFFGRGRAGDLLSAHEFLIFCIAVFSYVPVMTSSVQKQRSRGPIVAGPESAEGNVKKCNYWIGLDYAGVLSTLMVLTCLLG